MPETVNNYAVAMTGGCMLLSLLMAFYLFQKHVGGQPLLRYEPRRRVPWGPVWASAAVMIALIPIVDTGEKPTPTNDLFFGWVHIVTTISLVLMVMGCLVAFVRADLSDLGFPSTWLQLLRDVGLGALACLASLLPVFVIQFLLVVSSESQTQHPLVEKLIENHSPERMWMSWAAAVLAAPVFEEFIFRVLLQGWLERREDELLGFRASLREQDLLVDYEQLETSTPAELEEAVERAPPEPQWDGQRPSQGWIASLPHGWTPILLSGTLFGLAHFGHGVAWVPLVLLGIVLGYLYQRTHRLVPCIVAHMLFNAYSMTLLSLQLGEGS